LSDARREFTIVDVFARRMFSGNQLAVFADAQNLSDHAMQLIAREFNFAESAFVFAAQDPANTRRVRIFTPRNEIPFAGHPTLGAAAVLVHRGLVPLEGGSAGLLLETGIGPITAHVSWRNGAYMGRITLKGGVHQPDSEPSASLIAAALSLPAVAVIETWYASVGLPFCFVRLDSREAVDRALLNRAAWETYASQAWSSNLFMFAGELSAGETLYARMFAPAYGIEEDAATGSACAALAGTLAARLSQAAGTFHWSVEQGVALGRPSQIEASADKENDRVARVHVAGSVTVTAEGTMMVPDDC
jgi:trans-2,3-dihydro-3-hydroxyanthranilate isomerase